MVWTTLIWDFILRSSPPPAPCLPPQLELRGLFPMTKLRQYQQAT